MQYIMLLQIKQNCESEKELKAVKLPESNDTDTTYLYEILSHFARNNWVNLCGVIPAFECGCLSENDIKLWKEHLVDYSDIIKK